MPIRPGTSLDHYEILTALGAGGMGEVYRARDHKLGRDVAIKLLPAGVATDARRFSRFEREARALASLSHPNVATVFGFESAAETPFLVMELIEGETLLQRISSGPLPLQSVLSILGQVARGLEAAHRVGVLHRDLKPSNVMVTPDGGAKIVDFGLAKFLAPNDGVDSEVVTKTEPLTDPYTVMGTVPYISPELLRGQPTDRRTDIWAFGCVLYECLVGEKPFPGDTRHEIVLKILDEDPDWSLLPPSTPAGLVTLLQRCLRKDPHRRLQHIGDARIDLEDASDSSVGTPDSGLPRTWGKERRGHRLLVWSSIGFVLIALLVGWLWLDRPQPPSPVSSFDILPPDGYELSGPATLAPNGRSLAFAARKNDEEEPASGRRDTQLFLRSMASGVSSPLEGTNGAELPFFSPDGEWIGFFAGGEIKKISIRGGPAVSLGPARYPSAASWSDDRRIYFQPTSEKTIGWVSELGGATTLIDTPAESPLGLDLPAALPGGDALLVRIFRGREESPIGLLDLATGELVTLPVSGSMARYAPTGHLIYLRGSTLFAAPFDLKARELDGAEVIVTTGVRAYEFSDDGALVLTPGRVAGEVALTWIDRAGATERVDVAPGVFGGFELSPDGRWATVELGRTPISLWLIDLETGSRARLTQEGDAGAVAWTPDSRRISFTSNVNGSIDLWSMQVSPRESPAPLLVSEQVPFWSAWSSDARHLAFTEMGGATPDIFLLTLGQGSEPEPLVASSYSEWGPAFSPDDRWIAFASDESGSFEVYLQSLPDHGSERRLVSNGGGEDPVFSPRGDELFYRNGQSILSAAVSFTPELTVGPPELVVDADMVEVPGGAFGVSPDAQRFLILQSDGDDLERPALRVVVNWFEQLREAAPASSPR